MTCTEFLALLDDLIDDSVSPEMRAELQQHMKGCEHCEVTLNTTRKTIEIYRSHEIYDLPAGLRDRLHAAIMARCKKGCWAGRRVTFPNSKSRIQNQGAGNPRSRLFQLGRYPLGARTINVARMERPQGCGWLKGEATRPTRVSVRNQRWQTQPERFPETGMIIHHPHAPRGYSVATLLTG